MCFSTMSSGHNEKQRVTFIPDETSSSDQESNTTRQQLYVGKETSQSPHESTDDGTVFSSDSYRGEDLDGTKFAVQRLGYLSLQDKVITKSRNNTNSNTNNMNTLHMVSPVSTPTPTTSIKTMTALETESLSCDSSTLKPRSACSASSLSPSSSAPSLPNHPQDHSSVFRSSREQFLVFVKILLKCLEQTQSVQICSRAKKIIGDCTKRNRAGDPEFTPLMDAVEKRLRPFVGEAQWIRALLLLRHFIAQRMNTETRDDASAVIATAR